MSQKFVAYNLSTGAITGYYDSVDSPVPAGVAAIAATVSQWQAALTTPGYTVVAGALVSPSSGVLLAAAQAVQSGVLSSSCRNAITGGFTSSALGAAHNYGSQSNDQQNLGDATSASLAPGLAGGWTTLLWTGASGVWSLTAHTAAQVQQVHSDWIAFRLTEQQKLVTFNAAVSAATTAAQASAVVWS